MKIYRPRVNCKITSGRVRGLPSGLAHNGPPPLPVYDNKGILTAVLGANLEEDGRIELPDAIPMFNLCSKK